MREFLMKFVPPQDKLIHAWYGILLSLCFIPSVLFKINSLIPLSICLFFAVGIEIYQKITKTGQPDILDALAVMVAPILCYVLTVIQF